MAVRGERFEVNLSSSDDDEDDTKPAAIHAKPFVKDILEKENDSFAAPSPPRAKSTQNGFPEPRIQKGPSRFKREARKEVNTIPAPSPTPSNNVSTSFEEAERQKIDKENQKRIQNMSPEEIEQERKELLSGLSGSLIERLLKRSTIDEPQDDFDRPLRNKVESESSSQVRTEALSQEKVKAPQHVKQKKTVSFAQQEPPSKKQESVNPPEQIPAEVPQGSIHFPVAKAPSLDPSSSSFLQDLHQKYFPALPYDPQSLSWMAPLSSPVNSEYSPSAASFASADLRFDFSGNLLPPNLAHQIPTTKGLHHHGLAPEAAGYTISELSIYARSTVQAQRCMAFQTLGRFLFKLGTGIFGDDGGPDAPIDEEDGGALLCRGLWGEVRKEHILEILVDEAENDSRHQSAHALAVEAVWLWRNSGGRQTRTVEPESEPRMDVGDDNP